ncbi:MAG: iron-sulfur cluster repair di-iron protein, ric [Eubacteriales bacterium]|nr:iron-sulfur cluster repair di-iron protein, ric [Eubacteriales bacterium]
MSKQSIFYQENKNHFNTLEQYVPIVAKVHGGSHPEFHEVRKLFDSIVHKTKDAGANKPELNEEFVGLREITGNYTVPGDVCESYEAVYNILAEVDKAYNS